MGSRDQEVWGNTAIHHTVTVLAGSGNIFGYIFVFRSIGIDAVRTLWLLYKSLQLDPVTPMIYIDNFINCHQ